MIQGSLVCKEVSTQLREVIKRYESNEAQIEQLTKLRQDLLHFLESSRLDIQKAYKLYVEIREMSQSRRTLKNENCSIKPLYDYLKQNKALLNEIGQVQGNCKNQENCVNNATYTARIKSDIEDAVNQQISESGTKFDSKSPEKVIKYANHKDKIKLVKTAQLEWNKVSVDNEASEIHCWRSKLG